MMANRGGNEYECRVARRVSDKMPVRRAHLSPQTNYSVKMAGKTQTAFLLLLSHMRYVRLMC